MIWSIDYIELFGCNAMESRIYAELVELEALDLTPKIAVIINNFRGLEMHIPIDMLDSMPIPELHDQVLKLRELPPNEFRLLDIFVDAVTNLECFKFRVDGWDPLTQRFEEFNKDKIVKMEICDQPYIEPERVLKWLQTRW